MSKVKGQFESFRIGYAVQALVGFCENHGVNLRPTIIVAIAISLYEGSAFEWTPCADAFRRIYFTGTPAQYNSYHILTVWGYDGVNRELTEELNGKILKALGWERPPNT